MSYVGDLVPGGKGVLQRCYRECYRECYRVVEEGSTEDFTVILRIFGNARQLNSHNLDKYFVL